MENIFVMEEMMYLNTASRGILQSEFTRDCVLNYLTLAKNITYDDNDMVQEFLSGLIDKLNIITDEVWNDIKEIIPFKLAYEYEDISELPTEESV